MSTFLWAVGFLFLIDALGKFVLLAIGQPLRRTPFSMFLDVIIDVAFITWAIVLLSRLA
ncbi:hypothetical protein [Burkholderia glumae]|uniref:hypothetical protein n=1 Tax=Burkholderia glumae TaxID=337 RepID=UPI003B99B1F2